MNPADPKVLQAQCDEARKAIREKEAVAARPENRWADLLVKRVFEGRTGHGGGPCTRRNLRPDELRELAKASFDAGALWGGLNAPAVRALLADVLAMLEACGYGGSNAAAEKRHEADLRRLLANLGGAR